MKIEVQEANVMYEGRQALFKQYEIKKSLFSRKKSLPKEIPDGVERIFEYRFQDEEGGQRVEYYCKKDGKTTLESTLVGYDAYLAFAAQSEGKVAEMPKRDSTKVEEYEKGKEISLDLKLK